MNRISDQAVGLVEPLSHSAKPEEQRRRPRTERLRELVIHPMRDGLIGKAEGARSQDFSSLGLGLVHSEPMNPGDQFLVPLATRSGPPLPLLYSVVYCHQADDGTYKIGAELVSLLNMSEFDKRRSEGESIVGCISGR